VSGQEATDPTQRGLRTEVYFFLLRGTRTVSVTVRVGAVLARRGGTKRPVPASRATFLVELLRGIYITSFQLVSQEA
jgi:hypothetical protein